jgi:HAD superfamily hydrolase (TIGR01549 family)
MTDWAIIFDVDGVLLELTQQEEDLFFQPFISRVGSDVFSRDWNSYKIRNDENIVAELVERHCFVESDAETIKQEYLALLKSQLATGQIASPIIEGASELLRHCSAQARLGIATANFREAAQLRLQHAGVWGFVKDCAFGANGGGHKSDILGRVLAALALPKSHVIYIGDNLNDVEAGLKHQVHFIGFSTLAARLEQLKQAGATHLSSNHQTTAALIDELLKTKT